MQRWLLPRALHRGSLSARATMRSAGIALAAYSLARARLRCDGAAHAAIVFVCGAMRSLLALQPTASPPRIADFSRCEIATRLCRALAVVTRAAMQHAGVGAVARAVSDTAARVMGLRCIVAA